MGQSFFQEAYIGHFGSGDTEGKADRSSRVRKTAVHVACRHHGHHDERWTSESPESMSNGQIFCPPAQVWLIWCGSGLDLSNLKKNTKKTSDIGDPGAMYSQMLV